jgi:hypothetical protein
MDPFSLMSSVAAVISLADCALRLGTGICDIVAKVREANDLLNKLYTELQQLTSIIKNLKGLMDNLKERMERMQKSQEFVVVNNLDGTFSSIEDVLQSFINEVDEFKVSAAINVHCQQKSFARRITTQLLFVRNEKKINAILSRIAAHKLTLNVNLLILSMLV